MNKTMIWMLVCLSLLPIVSPALCANPYDLNEDGRVDITDVAIAARAFGTREGDPAWDPRADITKDGYVNMLDIAIVASHFGE